MVEIIVGAASLVPLVVVVEMDKVAAPLIENLILALLSLHHKVIVVAMELVALLPVVAAVVAVLAVMVQVAVPAVAETVELDSF